MRVPGKRTFQREAKSLGQEVGGCVGVVFSQCFSRSRDLGSPGLSGRTQMCFWLSQGSILTLTLGKGGGWGDPSLSPPLVQA